MSLLTTLALAQPVNAPIDPVSQLNTQREVIDSERRQLNNGFAAEDAVCHQRFAVNNCLDDVNIKRRVAMADLRRQDLLLNKQERMRRAASQLLKIEEKQSVSGQEEPAQRHAKLPLDYQSRIAASAQKQLQKKPAADVQAQAQLRTASRLNAAQLKQQSRLDQQAKSPQQAKKFFDRQTQAAKQRETHGELLRKKSARQVKSLPSPPAL